MLQEQQDAPSFSSINQDNRPISLVDYRGQKNVVLYFYPKDDTPGCTIEAKDFSLLHDEFAAQDTVVFGVSKDPSISHRAFMSKYELQLDLLADTSGELCELYGVWQEKERDGVKKMGIVRSTFIIDKQGRLVMVAYGVDANGHAQQVLERVKQIN